MTVPAPPGKQEETEKVDPDTVLLQWQQAEIILKRAKVIEMGLRKKLFDHFFPNPTEGTNTHALGEGYMLKGKYSINRNLDEAALPAVLEQLSEGTEDKVIKRKPSLVKSEYDKLSSEDKVIMDEAVTSKPGSPTLEIIAPKEKK